MPQCKTCKKKVRDERLAANPLCSRCGEQPHIPCNDWCARCIRVSKGGNEVLVRQPKRKADLHLCCTCHKAPRLEYSRQCQECKNESTRKWNARHIRSRVATPEERKKYNARRLVAYNVAAGKIQKKPCEVCGSELSEAHHHKGYEKEHALDVVWLCKTHHVARHRLTD
ncbi:MAG TPA: hypothetical protein VF077_12905 [Nitrospiraceae bacterium]